MVKLLIRHHIIRMYTQPPFDFSRQNVLQYNSIQYTV